MNSLNPPRPVVLCILDGWGHREICEHNAICIGKTPVLDRLTSSCPNALVDASELEVGLPVGQMGNSEVGHMNLGAGRVVLQDLPRIDSAIADGSFARSPRLIEFADALKATGGKAHVMGLLSPGGVHSHQKHIAELVETLHGLGVEVIVHAFLDGRDTPPRSALGFLENFLQNAPHAVIGSVSGRYYAMDRDKRWNRVTKAYHAMVEGTQDSDSKRADDALKAVELGYARDENDEFVLPTVIGDYSGMTDGDGLLMANFRADRAREILSALLDTGFDGFARKRTTSFSAAAGMVEYASQLNAFMTTIFPPADLTATLGEVVSAAGLKQLRIAETEKYAHVTFFFNGGREEIFEGEERVLVPSPDVATYDLQPEMSAPEVTDKLCAAIDSGEFSLIVCNYANGDMVGHTGDLEAAVKAVETIDACIGRLEQSIERVGGTMLVTADHGNAEQMSDPATGQPHTAHTMNKVPLILVNPPAEITALRDGRLADLAPSILTLMKLQLPSEMTGHSLIASAEAASDAAAE
ncbi:2,3-bisphosphoglycerate-independent phosphoglycerate mutase [Pelagibius sp. Alg239-R121]|uniref:2,3-bisphosphoglycerate-independent phosphoglycerate mutase n=1 Tax=Pelagibius sp. Alg239-R121 TaxID=2993448 RepID=UPI002AC31A4D|nr:2,3-bisphosphoglycerate-independent phosphoglycerate mutase [Pelagibius sp. Alg239-R121]